MPGRGGKKWNNKAKKERVRGRNRITRPSLQNGAPSPTFLAALEEQRRKEALRRSTLANYQETNENTDAIVSPTPRMSRHKLPSSSVPSSQYIWDSATQRYYAKREPGDVDVGLPPAQRQHSKRQLKRRRPTRTLEVLNLSRLIIAREIGGTLYSHQSRRPAMAPNVNRNFGAQSIAISVLRPNDPKRFVAHCQHVLMRHLPSSKRMCENTPWTTSSQLVIAPSSRQFPESIARCCMWSRTTRPYIQNVKLDTGHLSNRGELNSMTEHIHVSDERTGQMLDCCWMDNDTLVAVFNPLGGSGTALPLGGTARDQLGVRVPIQASMENGFAYPTPTSVVEYNYPTQHSGSPAIIPQQLGSLKPDDKTMPLSLVLKTTNQTPKHFDCVVKAWYLPQAIVASDTSKTVAIAGSDSLFRIHESGALSATKVPRSCCTNHTTSLCFADSNHNVLLAGFRNGTIKSWDTRTDPSTMTSLYETDVAASVHHLFELSNVGSGDRVVAMFSNSEHFRRASSRSKQQSNVIVFDRRKLVHNPVCNLYGHRSDHRKRRIAYLDPSHRFLLAGGCDGKLRAWDTVLERSVFTTPIPSEETFDNNPIDVVCGVSTPSRFMHLWVSSSGVSGDVTAPATDRAKLYYLRTRG